MPVVVVNPGAPSVVVTMCKILGLEDVEGRRSSQGEVATHVKAVMGQVVRVVNWHAQSVHHFLRIEKHSTLELTLRFRLLESLEPLQGCRRKPVII